MAKDTLTQKQQDIALISSYTAKGDLTKLEDSLNKGLDDGLTVNEIKGILVQMYAYCGFPRSLNAISTFIKVTDERTDLKEGKKAHRLQKIRINLLMGKQCKQNLMENLLQGYL